ncbi:MAG: hypothetical protein HYZ28_20570 [Myxococcales bacterium]|nr:hypothetical protein [Myxococcales bacterium]
MPITLDTLVTLLALFLAGVVLYLNLWRAVLCLWPPSIRIEAEVPADKMQVPAELSALEKEVLSLGFRPVGSRFEKPRFTRETISYDYACDKDGAFATLYLSRDGSPRLYFLTRTDQGAFVISANYRRPAREVPGRYFSAGLEDVSPERVYKAHLRRTASFGAPIGRLDQEGRLEAARHWFSGPGRVEVRQKNLHGLLWSLASLGMVAVAVFGKR